MDLLLNVKNIDATFSIKPGGILSTLMSENMLGEDEAVEQLATILTKEVGFYKNVVFPQMSETIQRVSSLAESALLGMRLHPTVVVLDTPDFVHALEDQALLSSPTRTYTEVKLQLPEELDVEKYLLLLPEETEADTKLRDHMNGERIGNLQKAYQDYIRGSINNTAVLGTLSKIQNVRDAYLVFGLTKALINSEAAEGALGSLNDYASHMKYVNVAAKRAMAQALNANRNAVERGTLIVRRLPTTDTIVISGEVSPEFYEKGGYIELIFGALYTEKQMFRVTDILDNADTLKAIWQTKSETFVVNNRARTVEGIKRIYMRELETMSQRIAAEADGVVTGGMAELRQLLEKAPESKVLNQYDIIERFTLDILLSKTNARKFHDSFEYYRGHVDGYNQNKPGSAALASVDLIVSFLMNQVEVA